MMFVSTGPISDDFEVIDSVMVYAARKAGFLDGPNIDGAFEEAKLLLIIKCEKLGGDAVINCRFEHRSAHSGGLMPSLVIEFFATGTVIKLRK